jgi:His/Glu/Gln/Arg/opine family amino acid ABC transporter permease subunit
MTDPFDYFPFVLSGVVWTVSLSLCSLALSVLIGLAGAAARIVGPFWLSWAVRAYVTIVRGVPDLVWMLLVYYGGQTLINFIGTSLGLWTYLEINQFVAGVFTIAFVFGAYMTETFRGGAMSIPTGQIEAGVSIGLKPARLLTRILGPQLFRNSLPSFTNNWLGMIKTTALVSVIGLPDVVYNAHSAGRATGKPFTFLLLALGVYLALTAVTDLLLRFVERRNDAGGWRI